MNNIPINVLKLFTTQTHEDLIRELIIFLKNIDINDFIIWDVKGQLCEPNESMQTEIYGTFDIYELGYNDLDFSENLNLDIAYFDIKFHINSALFLQNNGRMANIITFTKPLSSENSLLLSSIASYLGSFTVLLSGKDKRMDLYVDYQKKIDFVKNASCIFKAIDIKSVISMALSFFMEVFSADAVCSIYKDKFYGMGLNEDDIENDIKYADIPIYQYIKDKTDTFFDEKEVTSSKFNIKNIFFVCDEASSLKFILFNIDIDIVPDKEFSALISSIISIAAENALHHENMVHFRMEEVEMEKTTDILNKFVRQNIEFKDINTIHAISCPAKNAGGDYITMKHIDDDKYLFCIADVCGKGYSAAILTVVLSVFMSINVASKDLSKRVRKINQFLLAKNFGERFITAIFGIIDTKEKKLYYISCGHDPAVIINKNKNNIEYLNADFLPLGLFDEEYRESIVNIEENSTIFLYTDGLIEYAALDEIIDMIKDLDDKTSKEITQTLYTNLVTDKALQRDDFTCLIMKV